MRSHATGTSTQRPGQGTEKGWCWVREGWSWSQWRPGPPAVQPRDLDRDGAPRTAEGMVAGRLGAAAPESPEPAPFTTVHPGTWPELAQCSHEHWAQSAPRSGKESPAAQSMWKGPGFSPLSFSTPGNALVAVGRMAVGAHKYHSGRTLLALQSVPRPLPEPVTLCPLSHCLDQTWTN